MDTAEDGLEIQGTGARHVALNLLQGFGEISRRIRVRVLLSVHRFNVALALCHNVLHFQWKLQVLLVTSQYVCISVVPKADRRLSLRAGRKGVHRRYGLDLVRGRLGDKGTLAVAVILDDPLT